MNPETSSGQASQKKSRLSIIFLNNYYTIPLSRPDRKLFGRLPFHSICIPTKILGCWLVRLYLVFECKDFTVPLFAAQATFNQNTF